MSIGIVIPCNNNADTIHRTVACIRGQLLPLDRIALVENGSTDGTAAIVDEYLEDPQINVLHLEQGDAAAARNAGVAAVENCTYIAFCDGDDEWSNDKLPLLRAVIAACDPDIVWHPAVKLTQPGLLEQAVYAQKQLPWSDDFLADLVIAGNFLATSTLVLKTAAIPRPLFSDGLTRTQDYEGWCYFALHNRHPRACYIDAPLCYYSPTGTLSRDVWKRAVNVYRIQSSYATKLSQLLRIKALLRAETRLVRTAVTSGHGADYFKVRRQGQDLHLFRGHTPSIAPDPAGTG